jgi:hypothetical protein
VYPVVENIIHVLLPRMVVGATEAEHMLPDFIVKTYCMTHMHHNACDSSIDCFNSSLDLC